MTALRLQYGCSEAFPNSKISTTSVRNKKVLQEEMQSVLRLNVTEANDWSNTT